MIEPLHLKTIEVRNGDIQAARTLLRSLTSVSRRAGSRQGRVPERPRYPNSVASFGGTNRVLD